MEARKEVSYCHKDSFAGLHLLDPRSFVDVERMVRIIEYTIVHCSAAFLYICCVKQTATMTEGNMTSPVLKFIYKRTR